MGPVVTMQIEVLKLFCDVVRLGSITRAALENGSSQPSASQAIQQLEDRLEVVLFDRSQRPLGLTQHGRFFHARVRDLIGRYYELERRVKSLDEDPEVAGEVRVAAIYSVGLAHMSRFKDRFEALHPASKVVLDYLHPAEVLEAVRDGDAELGLISYPKKWPDLAVIPWKVEEMVLAVDPTHRLSAHTTVEAGDLDAERFIAFTPELPIRRAIDKFLKSRRSQVQVALEFDNLETIKRAVEVPSGVAILPRPALDRELAAGSIVAVRFRDPVPTRPLAVVHRKSAGLSVPAARFLGLLSDPETLGAESRVEREKTTAAAR